MLPDGPIASGDAEFIVINANVWTVDAQLPRAAAFAIRGGCMTSVPGFIDCHNHPDRGTVLPGT